MYRLTCHARRVLDACGPRTGDSTWEGVCVSSQWPACITNPIQPDGFSLIPSVSTCASMLLPLPRPLWPFLAAMPSRQLPNPLMPTFANCRCYPPSSSSAPKCCRQHCRLAPDYRRLTPWSGSHGPGLASKPSVPSYTYTEKRPHMAAIMSIAWRIPSPQPMAPEMHALACAVQGHRVVFVSHIYSRTGC